MQRRTFLIGSVGGVGLVVLGACSDDEDLATDPGAPGTDDPDGAPEPRPTIRLAGGDSGFPSPFAYSRGGGYIQMTLIYDTLLWKDVSGEYLPWLAESYEQSDDGLTYTFTLRPDIRWQDGEALTADDVVFTFDYHAAQDLSPQIIVQPLPTIAEVVAVDERTVEFRLESPTAIFLDAVADAVPIVPEHIWSSIEDAPTATDLAVLVGSGPYRLTSYSEGEGSYLYEANDDYFLGTPFVDRIENLPVGDELSALLSGGLDAAGGSGLRPEVLAPFESDDAYGIIEAPPGSAMDALYWNLGRGGALADPAFRHACARAIDRQDIVERLFGGNGTPGNPGWMPPGNEFHVDVEQYPFDVDEANAMLDDAGYTRTGDEVREGPDGPLRFTLLVTNPVPQATELVVAALTGVGVEVSVEALDTPTFNERVIAGDAELSIIGSGGVNSDPDYMREVYASTTRRTQHAQGYVNPRFDELAQRQLVTVDEGERMEIVAEMQEIVADDLPLLPLYYEASFHIFREDVFDQWYFVPGGVGVRTPTVVNRQVFVTGRQEGTEIRPFE